MLDRRTQKLTAIGGVSGSNLMFGIVISPLKVSGLWSQEYASMLISLFHVPVHLGCSETLLAVSKEEMLIDEPRSSRHRP